MENLVISKLKQQGRTPQKKPMIFCGQTNHERKLNFTLNRNNHLLQLPILANIIIFLKVFHRKMVQYSTWPLCYKYRKHLVEVTAEKEQTFTKSCSENLSFFVGVCLSIVCLIIDCYFLDESNTSLAF